MWRQGAGSNHFLGRTTFRKPLSGATRKGCIGVASVVSARAAVASLRCTLPGFTEDVLLHDFIAFGTMVVQGMLRSPRGSRVWRCAVGICDDSVSLGACGGAMLADDRGVSASVSPWRVYGDLQSVMSRCHWTAYYVLSYCVISCYVMVGRVVLAYVVLVHFISCYFSQFCYLYISRLKIIRLINEFGEKEHER